MSAGQRSVNKTILYMYTVLELVCYAIFSFWDRAEQMHVCKAQMRFSPTTPSCQDEAPSSKQGGRVWFVLGRSVGGMCVHSPCSPVRRGWTASCEMWLHIKVVAVVQARVSKFLVIIWAAGHFLGRFNQSSVWVTVHSRWIDCTFVSCLEAK